MKKILLICVFFMVTTSIDNSTWCFTNYDDIFLDFLEAYNHVRKWEGNYSYHENDRGGETYAGISRVHHPKWSGWKLIDDFKKTNTIYWNCEIMSLEGHVINFYYSIWLNNNYYQIKDKNVATYLFDYNNTGVVAVKHAQRILIDRGYCDVKITKILDEPTIRAINTIDGDLFISELKDYRSRFYERVAYNNPTLDIFLKGWLNRAKNIPS